MTDEILLHVFQWHAADARAALRRLNNHLANVELPFDLNTQLRKLSYPLQPRQVLSPPSIIYYFVPNSRRGSDRRNPYDPLDPAFLNATDGIGLNLGCPVRLLRALDALSQLSVDDQQQPREALRNPTQHLSAVEELLWLTAWKSPSKLRRGGKFVGMSGDVDWAFESDGVSIFLEAKFRQSDWPRLTDRGTFVNAGDGFLSSAAHKFPHPPQNPALHIVGITTFDNITPQIGDIVGHELESTPQVHAVIFRSLVQMTHVLSLSTETCERVRGLLLTPSISDLPTNHAVFSHIQRRNDRIAGRQPHKQSTNRSKVVCRSIRPRGEPLFLPEPDMYRIEIVSRGADGEPHFRAIGKYLMPNEAEPSAASI